MSDKVAMVTVSSRMYAITLAGHYPKILLSDKRAAGEYRTPLGPSSYDNRTVQIALGHEL